MSNDPNSQLANAAATKLAEQSNIDVNPKETLYDPLEKFITKVEPVEENASPGAGVTGETAPGEAAPAEPVVDPEVEKFKQERDQFAPKFAALSRKEKALNQDKKDFEAQKKALTEKLSRLEELEGLESRIDKNPLEYLSKRDIDFDKLTQMQLNEGNPTAEMMVQRMEKQFDEKLEARINELEQSYLDDKEQNAATQRDQAINDFVANITDYVNEEDHGDKYQLIKMQNAVPAVYQLIEDHYSNTSTFDEESGELLEAGKILSIEEATDLVEQELIEQVKKYATASKLGLTPQEVKAVAGTPGNTKTTTQQTLSNSQATKLPTEGNQLLTRSESLKRAASILNWN